MTDRFKFRAWNGHQMLTMPLDTFYGIHRFFGLLDMNNDSNPILMQSTGLKDKNGVLIYEGDILNINWFGDPEKCVKAVTYEEHLGWRLNQSSFWVWLTHHDDQCEVEIIGNIHKNKDLLS